MKAYNEAIKREKVGERILKGGDLSVVKIIEERAPSFVVFNILKKAKFMKIIFGWTELLEIAKV